MPDNEAVQNRTGENRKCQVKLSIIVISYNEAEYLPQAIESCLNQQGLNDFEIIIGDDGSSDSSLEIIQKYAEQWPDKIHYYVNDRNDGVTIAPIRVSNSIKKAMAIAKGEYLAVLSGDDFFCDLERFSADIAFLDTHPKYIACGSDFKLYHNDGFEQQYDWYGLSPALSWGGAYVHVSCFTFRRRVHEVGLLQYFCDDCGLVYSIGCCGDWYHRRKTTFAYRQRSQSIMHDAGQLELMMLEILMFQDILQNGRGHRAATRSRFVRPLVFVFLRRKHLKDTACGVEYLHFSAGQTPDVLNMMAEFENRILSQKLWCFSLLIWAICCGIVFRCLREPIIILYKLTGK